MVSGGRVACGQEDSSREAQRPQWPMLGAGEAAESAQLIDGIGLHTHTHTRTLGQGQFAALTPG